MEVRDRDDAILDLQSQMLKLEVSTYVRSRLSRAKARVHIMIVAGFC